MHMRSMQLATGLVCAFLVGCTTEPSTSVGVNLSEHEQDIASRSNDGDAVSDADHRDTILRLFALMDSIGPGSQDAYEHHLAEFLQSSNPIAAIDAVYSSLPSQQLAARWKAIYLASQIRSPEAVTFLLRVAAAPPEIAPSKTGHDSGDQGFRLRYTASVGIVQNYLASIAGADRAIDSLLTDADPQIAQLAALELFIEDRLTDRWRDMLTRRNISANFRAITGAELDALRRIDLSTQHQGQRVRTRPLATSVPTEDEH